jgi:hypothetical protein
VVMPYSWITHFTQVVAQLLWNPHSNCQVSETTSNYKCYVQRATCLQ